MNKMVAAFAAVLSVAVPPALRAHTPARLPVAVTERFVFYSDFDTNLSDALVAAGLRRSGKGTAPELFQAGEEAPCFGKLAPSVRAGWNRAVDYYGEIISPVDAFARQQYLVRVHLAGLDGEVKQAADRQFVEMAAAFRMAAAPAYRACRWAAQDADNRRWIEEVTSQLAKHGDRITSRLERLYRKQWGSSRLMVDVVDVVSWAGADSISVGRDGGHLRISSSVYQGMAALEVVFHEASHLLVFPGDPVRTALEAAAKAAQWEAPDDLWHPVMFYTTGEVVRQAISGSAPTYKMLLQDIYTRSRWGAYRTALETVWQQYVNGKVELAEASAALVAVLRRPY